MLPEGAAADGTPLLVSDESLPPFVSMTAGWMLDGVDFGRPDADYAPFVESVMRKSAAAADVPGSALSNDYAGASFSSLRAERVEAATVWQELQRLLIRRFYMPVLERHVRMHHGGAAELLASATWTPWRPPHLQLREAAQAEALEIQAGTRSRADVIRSRGQDPERMFSEIEEEARRLGSILSQQPP